MKNHRQYQASPTSVRIIIAVIVGKVAGKRFINQGTSVEQEVQEVNLHLQRANIHPIAAGTFKSFVEKKLSPLLQTIETSQLCDLASSAVLEMLSSGNLAKFWNLLGIMQPALTAEALMNAGKPGWELEMAIDLVKLTLELAADQVRNRGILVPSVTASCSAAKAVAITEQQLQLELESTLVTASLRRRDTENLVSVPTAALIEDDPKMALKKLRQASKEDGKSSEDPFKSFLVAVVEGDKLAAVDRGVQISYEKAASEAATLASQASTAASLASTAAATIAAAAATTEANGMGVKSILENQEYYISTQDFEYCKQMFESDGCTAAEDYLLYFTDESNVQYARILESLKVFPKKRLEAFKAKCI